VFGQTRVNPGEQPGPDAFQVVYPDQTLVEEMGQGHQTATGRGVSRSGRVSKVAAMDAKHAAGA